MQKKNNATRLYGWHSMALILLVLQLWTGRPASGQNAPPRSDNDTRGWQIANMDSFLDSHPEIAEQLQKDPSLIKNDEFVEKHPALQEYLQQHPGIREEFTENPDAFMRRERQYERQEDVGRGDRDDRGNRGDHDTTRAELATMDRFLDGHPEIGEQLRKDPSLIKNKEFVENHPALQEFLQTHPEVREEFREDPNAFMRQEERYERHEDSRNREWGLHDRGDVTSFGQFLGGHTTVAEQLTKDPSLANNKEFLASHPELQDYLKAHPGMQQELAKDPEAVMTSATRPATTPTTPKLEPKQKQ